MMSLISEEEMRPPARNQAFWFWFHQADLSRLQRGVDYIQDPGPKATSLSRAGEGEWLERLLEAREVKAIEFIRGGWT